MRKTSASVKVLLTLVLILVGIVGPRPSAMATELFAGIAVTDFGAPSAFSFSFILPIAAISNPSIVFDSLSGTLTDATGDGLTLTALAPPAGIPVDGDGIAELQVYTLSADGGVTWQNVGLDAGPTTTLPGPYGPFVQGPIPTIPGGPWTHMRVDLNFSLSGGGDQFDIDFRKGLLAVPGPGGALLLGLAFPAVLWVMKRARRRVLRG